MRRRISALSAVLVAAGLISSIVLFVFSETSWADGAPSQGTYTEGAVAGPDEPSLVDDTGSGENPDDAVIWVSGRPSGIDVVRVAKRYIGTDYRGGTCENNHMSCACLTKKVYAKFGQNLPFSEDKQWRYGKKVSKRQPGDLVFFKEAGRKKGITHVGIYSGNGNVVHASAYFDKVVESKMKYIKGYAGARRLKLR
jgi:cell wall-associated NlpC family hydrolase